MSKYIICLSCRIILFSTMKYNIRYINSIDDDLPLRMNSGSCRIHEFWDITLFLRQIKIMESREGEDGIMTLILKQR